MRRIIFILLLAGLTITRLPAATLEEAVRTADATRVTVTIAGNADRLEALLSDQLIYGHADGRVQNKADFLAAVRANRMRYEAYDYEEMHISPVAENVALISGRASLRVRMDEQQIAFRLRFLAVWHREAGTWRLYAYQSAQIPAPDSN